MEILYKGLAVQVEVTNAVAPVLARTSGAPEDCYEGDDGVLEFDIVAVEVDCQETYEEEVEGRIDFQEDEEFIQLVAEQLLT